MLTEQADGYDMIHLLQLQSSTCKEYKVERLLQPKEMDSGPCEAMGQRSRRQEAEYLLFYSNRLSPQ